MDRRIHTVLTSLCGVSLAVAIFGGPVWASWLAVAFGSVHALEEGWDSLRRKEFDVHILMLLAAAGSIFVGHPTEAAVLLFLFALAGTLEEFAMARTKSAIEGLIKLRPDEAIRIDAHGETRVPVGEIVVGDLVRVPAFQGVPLDGEIVEGVTQADESAMTGEARPVDKREGDRLLAGTQNLEGTVTIRVTAASGATMLEKVVALVHDAQENKASGERISQWFGQRYTFFVLGAALLSWGIRLAVGQAPPAALFASLTLLVALSPCALVISTPATTLSALAWAAQRGMLVRGGEFIETLGKIDTVFLDKTGTLTEGKFALTEICVCGPALVGAGVCKDDAGCWHPGEDPSQAARMMLGLAAALEQHSTHPLATAIVKKANEWELPLPNVENVRVVPGKGVEAQWQGSVVRIGQRRFFDDMPAEFEAHVKAFAERGETIAILNSGDQWAALTMADQPKPGVREALDKLRARGIKRIAMLTGDQPATAHAVAAQVGIDEVHAGLLPHDKEKLVADSIAKGQTLAFIGDGVNDAPSLARAHVGIGMGGLGSDIALNAADVVLMDDKVDRISDLMALGSATRRTIRANLVFAGVIIGLLTLNSVLWGALVPGRAEMMLPIAVIGHEGSTVIVILNGLRLLAGPRGL